MYALLSFVILLFISCAKADPNQPDANNNQNTSETFKDPRDEQVYHTVKHLRDHHVSTVQGRTAIWWNSTVSSDNFINTYAAFYGYESVTISKTQKPLMLSVRVLKTSALVVINRLCPSGMSERPGPYS